MSRWPRRRQHLQLAAAGVPAVVPPTVTVTVKGLLLQGLVDVVL